MVLRGANFAQRDSESVFEATGVISDSIVIYLRLESILFDFVLFFRDSISILPRGSDKWWIGHAKACNHHKPLYDRANVLVKDYLSEICPDLQLPENIGKKGGDLFGKLPVSAARPYGDILP